MNTEMTPSDPASDAHRRMTLACATRQTALRDGDMVAADRASAAWEAAATKYVATPQGYTAFSTEADLSARLGDEETAALLRGILARVTAA